MAPFRRWRLLLLAAALACTETGGSPPALRAQDGNPAPEDPKKEAPQDADLDPEREILREAKADPRTQKPDAFPVLRNPVYAGALEAPNMDPVEWVLGVAVGKTVLAFPVNILNQHEILVDTVEGAPLLVCWSPLCRTGTVWSRTLEGQTLDFGHAGMLYRNAFLLYDAQTKSLWNHATGRALTGKMRGKRLAPLPCRFVPWDAWRKAYPGTRVLAKDSTDPDHARDRQDARNRELRLQYGLGIAAGDEERLYEISQLERMPLVQEIVGGVPVAVLHQGKAKIALAWERTLEGRVLDLRRAEDGPEEMPRLEETGEDRSVFDAVTGACLTGPLKGKALKPVLSSFWETYAWTAHHPRGTVFRASVPPPVDLPDVPK